MVWHAKERAKIRFAAVKYYLINALNDSRKYYLNAQFVNGIIPFAAKLKLELADWRMRFSNGLLNLARKAIYRKPVTPRGKILIFRTGSLGDSLCAIPVIKNIAAAYPGASIDILTNAGQKDLVGLGKLLPSEIYHEIIDYYAYSKKELFKSLRSKGYDLVIQLPQVDARFRHLMRDLLFFRIIAPAGFGWHVSQIKLFRKVQARYLEFSNEINRLQWLIHKQSGIGPSLQQHILLPSPEDLQFAQKVINNTGITNSQKLLAIVVGAKRPQNRWPINYFRQVAEHFSDTCTIILIGSKEDNELVKELVSIKNVINTCGSLTPLQSAAAISLCSLTISNDTGPMHLSYAVGTPTIALFSSRDLPGKWYPPNKTNCVFRTPNVHCEACFSETCNNNICMQAILPHEIINCAEQILMSNHNSSH